MNKDASKKEIYFYTVNNTMEKQRYRQVPTQERTIKYKPSRFARMLEYYQTLFFYNFGGPKIFPLRYTVNFFKGLTFLWIFFLMKIFYNITPVMWWYLFMHGSYGLCWLIKDCLFPDGRGKNRAAVGSHLVLIVVLMAYWCIPVPLVMRYGMVNPSLQRKISLLVMYLLGLVLMMGSDYQKYKTLQTKKGLITTYFFKLTRNPNYLGQFLIYNSFCMLSGHLLGFIIFYSLGGVLFMLNIYLKEQISFKAKRGYEEYKKGSNIFLIKFCDNKYVENAIYAAIVGAGCWMYSWDMSLLFFYPFDHLGELL